MKDDELHAITITKGEKPTSIKPERIKEITEEVMCWRKANMIHKWFVDNVQGGNDDCREHYVAREQLIKLRDLCRNVLLASTLKDGKVNNGYSFKDGEKAPILVDGKTIEEPSVAQRLLPTTDGFFFGGTDYDQCYIDDLKYTDETLTALLVKPDGGDFYYDSSW